MKNVKQAVKTAFDFDNVAVSVDGSIVTMQVDMAKAEGEETSGGNIRLASTLGNKAIIPENTKKGTGAVMLSVNLFAYAQTKAQRRSDKAAEKAATKGK